MSKFNVVILLNLELFAPFPFFEFMNLLFLTQNFITCHSKIFCWNEVHMQLNSSTDSLNWPIAIKQNKS